MAKQEFARFLLFLRREKLASAIMGSHPNDFYDYVDLPTTPQTTTKTTTTPIATTTPLSWELIAIGGGVAVVVIVLAIVLLRRK